eukprot:TRINITY_DN4506_c0_g1_i3.p1 TRINITY_DN4506_c0_g1~~TRINITY_DN4506_c0_g1_i3.p1  ORF type:complete len:125 (+),score=25.68 TRINITY_DN4506_c0_g1_i3:34-408(+)
MRLLSHNLLMCNVKGCSENNYPLRILVQKSKIIEAELNPDFLRKLVTKLDWKGLHTTLISLDFHKFPEQLAEDDWKNEEFLKELHNVLMQTHIIEGKLVCPNCQREYPIVNGIPNMILKDSELK